MTTYKTGSKLGSSAVKDLADNAENLDRFVNDRERDTWDDRLGRTRLTLKGLEDAAVSAGPTVDAAVRAQESANKAKESAENIEQATRGYITRSEIAADKSESARDSVESMSQAIFSLGSGQEFFLTEGELLATQPSQPGRVAKALDTKKVWLWKAGGTGVSGSWIDTGLSDLDLAKNFIDTIVSVGTDTNKIFEYVDSNLAPVMSMYKDKTLWIPRLKKDIASSINDMTPLLESVYIEKGSELLFFKDVNGVPLLRVFADLEAIVGKYDLKAMQQATEDIRKNITVQEGNDFIRFIDANNAPLIRLLANQDLLIPKVGNLTQTVLDLKRSAEASTGSQSAGGSGSEGADCVLATLTNKPSSGVLTALLASTVNAAGVFPHAVNLIRIPALTRIQKNTFLCFLEARVDGNDFGRNSQGVCTLTVDTETLTVTMSNLIALHSAEAHPTVENAYYTFMNACAVKLDSGRIITLYVKRYGQREHYIYKRYSDDDGLTWSAYEDIGTQLNMARYNLLCPCSQGMVKRYGLNQGRIIFPVWYSGPDYRTEEFRAGFIYSDDGGTTWIDGAFNTETQSNEVQCAEDVNGDILFCIRRETEGAESKTWSKLKNGEMDLTPFKPNQVISRTRIMSGLIQAKNKYDLSVPKYQFISTNTPGRRNLKMFTSYDGGLNWIDEYDVPTTSAGSAYSCIERLNEYYTFILWENGPVNEFKCQIVSLNTLLKR